MDHWAKFQRGDIRALRVFPVWRADACHALSCVCSVAPRRLLLVFADLLTSGMDRKRVSGPKLCLASEETSRRIVSMEDVLSIDLGSVSPSNCQGIFGLRKAVFFARLRFFQTEERFIERLLFADMRSQPGTYLTEEHDSSDSMPARARVTCVKSSLCHPRLDERQRAALRQRLTDGE